MPDPQVRVKLTAEGLQEVTAALKKVQAEGSRASKNAAGGFKAVRSQLGGIKSLAAGIGLTLGGAATVRSIVRISDEMLRLRGRLSLVSDSAEEVARVQGELFKIAQRTRSPLSGVVDLYVKSAQASEELGVSQQQVLQFTEGVGNALIVSGASAAQASGALLQLSQALNEGTIRSQEYNSINEGAPEILRAVARNIEGVDGSLAKLRRRMLAGQLSSKELFEAFLADTADLAARAQGLPITVGQAFVQLQNNIDTAIAEADLSPLTDSINDLSSTVANPAFQQGFASFLGGVTSLSTLTFEGFSKIGGLAGRIKDVALLSVGALGEIEALELKLGDVNRALAGEHFFDRLGLGLKPKAELLELQRLLESDLAARRNLARLQAGLPAREPLPAAAADTPDDETVIDPAAALAARQLALENELKVLQATNKARADADKRAFANGLLSLQEYFDRRRALIEQEARAEIELLNAELRVAEQAEDDPKQAEKAAALRAQIKVREIDFERELLALADERAEIEKQGAQARLELQQQLLEAQGREREARIAAIDEEIAKRRQAIEEAGLLTDQVIADLERLRAVEVSRIDFDATVADARAALESLAVTRARIEQDVELGILTQLGGQQRLLEVEQARLPVLRQLADTALEVARASGNQELIAQAEQLAVDVGQVAVSVHLAGDRWAEYGDKARSAITGDFENFFADTIRSADSLGGAFKSLADSIVDSLGRIAAEIVAKDIANKLFGTGGDTGYLVALAKIFGGAQGAAGGGPIGAASGGMIRGRGTGTSDSIPALLSDGEYVMPAKITQKPGMRQLFDDIRAGLNLHLTLPRFAAGGLVGDTTTTSSVGRDGMKVVNNLTIQAPTGSVSRATEQQVATAAYRGALRAYLRNR